MSSFNIKEYLVGGKLIKWKGNKSEVFSAILDKDKSPI